MCYLTAFDRGFRISFVLGTNASLKSCRCGENKKKFQADFKSCGIVDGQNRTKSPCFTEEASCSDSCRCVNCVNIYGIRQLKELILEQKKKVNRKRRHDVAFNRDKSLENLKNRDIIIKQGSWTDIETIAFIICLEVVCELESQDMFASCYYLYDLLIENTEIPLSKRNPYG